MSITRKDLYEEVKNLEEKSKEDKSGILKALCLIIKLLKDIRTNTFDEKKRKNSKPQEIGKAVVDFTNLG
jgi:hypothetical protein